MQKAVILLLGGLLQLDVITHCLKRSEFHLDFHMHNAFTQRNKEGKRKKRKEWSHNGKQRQGYVGKEICRDCGVCLELRDEIAEGARRGRILSLL